MKRVTSMSDTNFMAGPGCARQAIGTKAGGRSRWAGVYPLGCVLVDGLSMDPEDLCKIH
jgi:hypothetical protein